MIVFFVIFIFLSGIIESESNEKEICIQQKLSQCSDQYKTGLKFYPSNIDDLKNYCRTIDQKNECFRNSWMDCVSIEKERQIILSRLNETSSYHYKDICNFTTIYSKLFVKYGKCLNITVGEQNKCRQKYQVMRLPKEELLTAAGYDKNKSRTENFQKIRQICCWWVEYQSCVVRAVVDRCGEHAAILVNEEFYKMRTSGATARYLTYKSCLPQDNTFRYPVCLLDKSVDLNSIGVNNQQNDMITIEDNSRMKDIEETIGLTSNLTDFANIEAVIQSETNSVAVTPNLSQILMLTLILIKFY